MIYQIGVSKIREFLSIQAQDFIEDRASRGAVILLYIFLSIQAQDFIEDAVTPDVVR